MNREHKRPARPEWVFHYQYGYKLLAHGKLCPWCKETLMDAEHVELVYRASLTNFSPEKNPASAYKLYYHKLNWDYVCSAECALEMRMAWHNSFKRRLALKEKILSTPSAPKIAFKPDDDYRTHVLKICRLDPRLHPNLEVMHTSIQPWIYS